MCCPVGQRIVFDMVGDMDFDMDSDMDFDMVFDMDFDIVGDAFCYAETHPTLELLFPLFKGVRGIVSVSITRGFGISPWGSAEINFAPKSESPINWANDRGR
jgi:hypothetical protein